MLFYSALLATILLLSIFESILKNRNKFFLILVKILPFLLLFCLSVLKKDTVGSDSISYHNWYDLLLAGKNPGGSYSSVESGFKVLIETFASLGLPYLLFLSICYIIVYLPTAFVTIKISKNSCFSAYIYTCFSIVVLNFSAIRQAIAISLVLLALFFLLKKRALPTIISLCLIILASTFHKSSLVFLIVIPLSFINKFPKSLVYYLVPFAVLFFILTPTIIISVYYSFLYGSPYYPITREGVGEYYFIFLIIFSLLYLYENEKNIRLVIKKKISFFKDADTNSENEMPNNNNNFLLLVFFVGILFQSTSQINYAFPRFATQFLAIISLALPNVLYVEPNKKLRRATLLLSAIFFYLFFLYDSILPNYLGICPYLFFWQ